MFNLENSELLMSLSILQEKFPDKEPMWYYLTIYGVWCKGLHGRCYLGDKNSCDKCEYYNEMGSNP